MMANSRRQNWKKKTSRPPDDAKPSPHDRSHDFTKMLTEARYGIECIQPFLPLLLVLSPYPMLHAFDALLPNTKKESAAKDNVVLLALCTRRSVRN